LRDFRLGRAGAYAATLGLVLIGLLTRWALDPVFASNHAYTVFYPIVIVSAYFLGGRPAILAMVLSAVIGYWRFDRPAYAFKTDLDSLTSLGFFVMTSSVAIYFITGMARAVAEKTAAQARAERLAQSHATLFGELNERVTNHLQLVAALLQLQAKDEPDKAVARALGEASARTMLISKTHRSLAGGGLGEAGELLDFDTFARQLLDATLSARKHPPVRIEFEDGGLWLSSEQATSVAIVLLECLNLRLAADDPGLMRIALRGDRGMGKLRITEVERELAPVPVERGRASLIEAMVEQLRGRFSSRSADEGRVSELTFPLEAGAHGVRGGVATVH
jgi:two-component sensor histidine kinase